MGKTLKLTEAVVEQLWREDEVEFEGISYEVVEQGEWEDEGKYSNADLIFKDQDSTTYRTWVSKSGSYFTDYEYQFGSEAQEVAKKKVTIERWENI